MTGLPKHVLHVGTRKWESLATPTGSVPNIDDKFYDYLVVSGMMKQAKPRLLLFSYRPDAASPESIAVAYPDIEVQHVSEFLSAVGGANGSVLSMYNANVDAAAYLVSVALLLVATLLAYDYARGGWRAPQIVAFTGTLTASLLLMFSRASGMPRTDATPKDVLQVTVELNAA